VSLSRASRSEPLIAIVTCAAFPDLDPDDQLLLPALTMHGMTPRIAVWNDSTVQWSDFDLVLIRSTWDYSPQRKAFLEWAKVVSERTRLVNPTGVVQWSSDKHYLLELAAAGVPTVQTSFIEIGDPFELPDSEFVVKPAISAGSRDTYRLSADKYLDGMQAVADIHLSGRSVMIQPYLKSVDTAAETALIFVAGNFSHAIRKGPLLELDQAAQEFHGGLFIKEEISARTATQEQRRVAEQALSVAPPDWLYARVDLINDDDGNPVVLELEMVEPSLFFAVDPDPISGAPGRLAQALANLCEV